MGLQELLGAYLVAYVPWVAYTTLLYRTMERRTVVLSERRTVVPLYVGSLVIFLVPEILWQVAAVTLRNAADPVKAFLPALRRWPAELWLLDLALMTGSFMAIYAIVTVREGRALRARQQAADAERLALQLELEQQRLRGLRAQLEPHFLFNALSAIAGLVRSNDQRVAIDAIGQLSAQLRHAITACATPNIPVRRPIPGLGSACAAYGTGWPCCLERPRASKPARRTDISW
ncbi:MAG: histidine kinase [Gemmatimonadetes bacterium]|nr:histidine kinase [Gemmatimonadota bacterium]